jgi:hypothetical protein
MRTYEEYEAILKLWELGIPKKRIGIMLDIPRPTVRDCIERYGNVEGLAAQRERANKSTPNSILERIQDAQNGEVQTAYAYVLGIYLGDGYIVRNKRVYFLRIFLDNDYPNIIQTCARHVQTLLPDNRVNILRSMRGDFSEVVCTYKFWPEVFPQHGSGAKHTRKIILDSWQHQIVDAYPLEFLRGLYHSDGSRYSNIVKGRDYPRYQFTNVSDDIRGLFCWTCDRLGLQWTSKARDGREYDIYISKRPDVAYLDTHIGPKT